MINTKILDKIAKKMGCKVEMYSTFNEWRNYLIFYSCLILIGFISLGIKIIFGGC